MISTVLTLTGMIEINIDSFGAIPSHPLLVHIPVVLLPLSLLGTILMVIVPNFRRRHGSLAIMILAIGFAGTILAARSGTSLERINTDGGQSIPKLLQNHADMGNRLQYLVGIYLVMSIIWIVRARRSGSDHGNDGHLLSQQRIISMIIIGLVLAAGSSSTWSTLQTAHSGVRSVWEQVTPG